MFYVDNTEIVSTENETIVVAKRNGNDNTNLGQIHLFVEYHRTEKPKKDLFTLENVENILRNGDDSVTNVLAITLDGELKLVPFSEIKKDFYAVKHEAFAAGNGYVGHEESLNDANEIYLAMLNAWKIHLESCKSIFVDYHDKNYDEESLLSEIKEAIVLL